MSHTPKKRSGTSPISGLIAVTVLGQLIAYVIAVVVARNLTSAEFQAYAVSSSVFIVMVIIAMRGLEKYGLRFVSAKLAESCSAKVMLAYHYGTFDLPPGSFGSCDPDDSLVYIQHLQAEFLKPDPGEVLYLPFDKSTPRR